MVTSALGVENSPAGLVAATQDPDKRAELAHDGWFKSGWRSAIGWMFSFSLAGLATVTIVSIARDPSLITEPQVMGMMAWLIGTLGAAVGINVRERSKDKARQLGKESRTLMDTIKGPLK